jgi:hypothetical protein
LGVASHIVQEFGVGNGNTFDDLALRDVDTDQAIDIADP